MIRLGNSIDGAAIVARAVRGERATTSAFLLFLDVANLLLLVVLDGGGGGSKPLAALRPIALPGGGGAVAAVALVVAAAGSSHSSSSSSCSNVRRTMVQIGCTAFVGVLLGLSVAPLGSTARLLQRSLAQLARPRSPA